MSECMRLYVFYTIDQSFVYENVIHGTVARWHQSKEVEILRLFILKLFCLFFSWFYISTFTCIKIE